MNEGDGVKTDKQTERKGEKREGSTHFVVDIKDFVSR